MTSNRQATPYTRIPRTSPLYAPLAVRPEVAAARGSRASSSVVRGLTIDTGNLFVRSSPGNPFDNANVRSVQQRIANSPDLMQPRSTYGRMTPPWDSVSPTESSLSGGTLNSTGSPFGPPPSPESLSPYQPTCVLLAIGPFGILHQILIILNLWSAHVSFTGVQLELASHGGPLRKLGWELIIRIPGRNGGSVTRVKNMLSSTSFEELLTSPISSGGSTVTRYLWKRKDLVGR